jgi:methionyl-tRNA formyltransferase
MSEAYLVATTKPWNIEEYMRFVASAEGQWHLVEDRRMLTRALIEQIKPRYVFFPHWSWKVPPEVFGAAECILFHMTDLPFGRGGSPLQNLIASGATQTMVSAVRMTGEIDAGPIYLKEPLALDGSAGDIFRRLAGVVFEMIGRIVASHPKPLPQSGVPTYFKRRTPEQSVLPNAANARDLYDHIRMLDADTYPRAFLDLGRWRLEFSGAELVGEDVVARVLFHAPNKAGQLDEQ